jgi:hypothetical protein
MRTEEALPHRVQRTRTDVSVDDTEGGQRQRQEATARAGGVELIRVSTAPGSTTNWTTLCIIGRVSPLRATRPYL